MPRTNIPSLDEIDDIHEMVALHTVWSDVNASTACCGFSEKICECEVCLSVYNVDSIIGHKVYDKKSDCLSCFHYRKFSCASFLNYVQESAIGTETGQWPSVISSCADFIWRDSIVSEEYWE